MVAIINKKNNPLQIRKGDIVTIHFSSFSREGPFVADVTNIICRADIGQDAYISYRRHDGKTNEPKTPDGCSVSHVKSVVHAPYSVEQEPPTNIFRDKLLEDRKKIEAKEHGWIGWYEFGDTRVGLARDIIGAALATSHDNLVRPVYMEKFALLWEKAGCPGKVVSPDEEEYPSRRYLSVRWKTFKKWVLKNRYRLMLTQKEIEALGREYQRDMEEAYFEDLDREFEREYDYRDTPPSSYEEQYDERHYDA